MILISEEQQKNRKDEEIMKEVREQQQQQGMYSLNLSMTTVVSEQLSISKARKPTILLQMH
mgnify:CR=1 FL=1